MHIDWVIIPVSCGVVNGMRRTLSAPAIGTGSLEENKPLNLKHKKRAKGWDHSTYVYSTTEPYVGANTLHIRTTLTRPCSPSSRRPCIDTSFQAHDLQRTLHTDICTRKSPCQATWLKLPLGHAPSSPFVDRYPIAHGQFSRPTSFSLVVVDLLRKAIRTWCLNQFLIPNS